MNQRLTDEITSLLAKAQIVQNLARQKFISLFVLGVIKSRNRSGPCRLTSDLLGLMTGMDGSSAFRNRDTGLSPLQSMLSERDFAPVREFKSVDEFEEYFQEYETLLIDGEEQPIQRPSDEDSQRDNFSAKKKGTTLRRP